MKFNISYPQNGTQKCFEIDDDNKCRIFYDKRMGTEVEADGLGDEFKGYILKISGGNDKDGFPMKQGIILNGRTKVLMSKGHSCYRPRRTGERKRKTVRGCVVGPDLRVVALTIVKKGVAELAGLTDDIKPKRLGPKRASKLRKLLNIPRSKEAHVLVRKVAIRRTWTAPNGKQRTKAPKIQRLVTDERLRRKRIYKKEKVNRWTRAKAAQKEYNTFLAEWRKKKEAKKSAEIAKKRSSEEVKKAPAVVPKTQTAAKTQAAKTQAPKTQAAAPKTQAPAPKTQAPAPKTQAAAPKTQAAAPKTQAPKAPVQKK
jgi:small subunit ribosomal protein S6e